MNGLEAILTFRAVPVRSKGELIHLNKLTLIVILIVFSLMIKYIR